MTFNQVERHRKKFYSYFEKTWQKALFKEAIPILEALKNPVNIYSFQHINPHLDYTELFVDTWTIPGHYFAKLTQNEYRNSKAVKAEWQDDYLRNELHRYAIEEAGQRITSIKTTNRDALIKTLNNQLDLGTSNGLGSLEIAMNMQDAIKGEYAAATRMQALRIARTEVVGATCKGQVLGAQSLGYDMRKTWIATIDSATRDAHKFMAGRSVGLNDNFMVPSNFGMDTMAHPGDARASAGNVINCRCCVGFEVL